MNEPANASEIISASEINRFIYCRHRWYYERYYGNKHIRELYNERNAKLGLNDPTLGKFAKGNKFHKNYLANQRRAAVLKVIAFIVILTAIICVCAVVTMNR